jgi:SAM-dependent methyltransferase
LNLVYTKEYWNKEDTEATLSIQEGWVARFNTWRLKGAIKPLLKALPHGALVLEVGCGAGQLTKILIRNGFRVEVTEHSREILDWVTQKLDVPGYLGDLTTLSFNQTFDAVIFNHVLEHVLTPKENLKTAVSVLKPGGIIFIELPNINSLQFKWFGPKWFPLEIPSHLTHFSPQTLDHLAEGQGLKLKWRSFFSSRVSLAGIVVSFFPSLHPRVIRKSRTHWKLFIYFFLQILCLPLAISETLMERGGIMRTIYVKEPSPHEPTET